MGKPLECQTVWIHFVGPDLGHNCFQKISADDDNWLRDEASPLAVSIIVKEVYRENIKPMSACFNLRQGQG